MAIKQTDLILIGKTEHLNTVIVEFINPYFLSEFFIYTTNITNVDRALFTSFTSKYTVTELKF